MKIAFVTPEFPHEATGASGGIGTSIFNLSQGLSALGHEVLILVYGQDEDRHFVENQISICKIKNIKLKGISFYLTQKKIERLINTLHKQQKIDIVEAPDWTGFSAFINPNCPLVIRLNGSDTYFCHLDGRNVKLKNTYLEKRALQKAKGIISVSDFTGKMTNKLFKLKKAYTVIPNAININAFKPLNSLESAQTIMYFGTLIRKKGLLELPLIFNEVQAANPEAKLILVGKDSFDVTTNSASTWALMQPLLTKAALRNTNYMGAVPYHDIQKLLKDATVCVFPTFAEALPVSWLEAMAMEKAIVASNVGWAVEMITDAKEGYLVHPKDHKLYARKISDLLHNKPLREAFGTAARQKVATTFSNEIVAQQSVDFYNTILAQ